MEPLNGHEFLGALSSRVVHALSNYAAALSGNLMILNSDQTSAEQKAAALAGINAANKRSAALLDRFADLSRAMHTALPCPFDELFAGINQWVQTRAGWTLETAPGFMIQPNLAIAGPSNWLQFILNTIADKIGPASIRISLLAQTRSAALITSSQSLSLVITPHAPDAQIDWEQQRQTLGDWHLAVAYELLAQLGARPQTIPKPGGGAQIQILLPLAHGESSK